MRSSVRLLLSSAWGLHSDTHATISNALTQKTFPCRSAVGQLRGTFLSENFSQPDFRKLVELLESLNANEDR